MVHSHAAQLDAGACDLEVVHPAHAGSRGKTITDSHYRRPRSRRPPAGPTKRRPSSIVSHGEGIVAVHTHSPYTAILLYREISRWLKNSPRREPATLVPAPTPFPFCPPARHCIRALLPWHVGQRGCIAGRRVPTARAGAATGTRLHVTQAEGSRPGRGTTLPMLFADDSGHGITSGTSRKRPLAEPNAHL